MMEQHTRRKIQGFLVVVGITFLILLIGLPGARHSVRAATTAIKATLIRDVDNPANAPFTTFIEGTNPIIPYQVPATLPDGRAVKRLVIESVSGYCNTSTGVSLVYVSAHSSVGSQPMQHFIVPTQPVADVNLWLFTQVVRMYADPNSIVYVDWTYLIPGEQQVPLCHSFWSGYFVTQ